jgi:hypothetical protein
MISLMPADNDAIIQEAELCSLRVHECMLHTKLCIHTEHSGAKKRGHIERFDNW